MKITHSATLGAIAALAIAGQTWAQEADELPDTDAAPTGAETASDSAGQPPSDEAETGTGSGSATTETTTDGSGVEGGTEAEATDTDAASDTAEGDAPAAAEAGEDGTATAQKPAEEDAPEDLRIYFDTGTAGIGPDQRQQLDAAARLFRDGNPVVMVVAGSADTVGDPRSNLDLSIRRARAVADGLVDRGIPTDRLQVLGRGNSELPVVTEDGVANAENRSVVITWR